MLNLFKKEKLTHPHYTIVDNANEADALAWVYIDEKTFKQVPFKFQELQPNEIRANVLYTGLCHSDSSTGRKKWDPPIYPVCPGHEIVAEVAMIGSKVKNFKIGDKVGFGVIRTSCGTCDMCKKDKETHCVNYERAEKATYNNFWGGWATQIQHPEDFFFKIPEGADLQKSGTAFCAACTVYGPIKTFIEKGDKCLVIGVGGLGHYAIKILSKMGYEVSALTHSKDKKDDIIKMGAKSVIFLENQKDVKEHSKEFDFVINTQPSFEDIEPSLELCAPECKYVMVGIPEKEAIVKVKANSWILKDIILIGSLNGSRKLSNEVLDFIIKNDAWPIVEEFKFEDFEAALKRMEDSSSRYRIVVNVQDFSKNNGWFKKANNIQ